MKKIAIFALLTVVAGCSDDKKAPDLGKAEPVAVAAPTSVDYYLAHEDEMQTKIRECNAMSAQERQGDAACETAALAKHRAMGNKKFIKLLPGAGVQAEAEKEKARTNPGQ